MSTATQTPVTTRAVEQFASAVGEILNRATTQQGDAIQAAGALVFRTLELGGLLHTFGTGHSHLLAEEIYSRAGGLLPVNVIQSAPLMLHEDAVASGDWERLPGVAAVLLEHAAVDPARDTLILVSNSGRNAVPVEAAEWARARGVPIIALTSLAHSQVPVFAGTVRQEAVRACGRRSRQRWPAWRLARGGSARPAGSGDVHDNRCLPAPERGAERCRTLSGVRHSTACSDLGQRRRRA